MDTNIETPGQEFSSNNPTPAPTAPKAPRQPKFKKPLLIALATVLLVGLGLGGWYLMTKDSGNSGTPTNPTSETPNGYISETTDGDPKPFALLYASRPSDNDPYEVFWKPIGGGDAKSVFKLETNEYLTRYGAVGKYAYMVIEGQDGPVVWLSDNGGQSYEKVFIGAAGSGDGFGDQITSAILSNDQKRLLIAVYGSAGQNTVKEISTVSRQVTDLFTVDDAGVFLSYYDSAKTLIYYSKGCYNCDGNTLLPLLVRDVANNQDKTLVDATDKYLLDRGINPDMPELLYVLGSFSADGLGASAPYSLNRYNLETGETTQLKQSDTESRMFAGFGRDNRAYYIKDSGVYDLEKDTLLFDAEKPVESVHYVSADLVVVSSGDFSNFQVATYDRNAKQAASLLTGDINTSVIGVTEL